MLFNTSSCQSKVAVKSLTPLENFLCSSIIYFTLHMNFEWGPWSLISYGFVHSFWWQGFRIAVGFGNLMVSRARYLLYKSQMHNGKSF